MHPYVKRGAGLIAGVLIMAATATSARADIIKMECGAPAGELCRPATDRQICRPERRL